MRWLWKGHRFWWRISGGHLGRRAAGLPVLELTTTGRRSGEPRSVLLNFVNHPDGWVVVASNAGASSPPAWWRNLEAHQEAIVMLAGERTAVRASVLDGHERDRAWPAFVAANPDYERYAAEAGREIPVVLLRRVERDPSPTLTA
jgi:deazaflavin-dependent oxidoreductase (nitroreductase family)